MSEHELWNELGNLYFISGTYNQAAYAYNRSIQLDSGFGRPYCNLALTYVKQGRYSDAVRLYQRSIELLVDDRDKAITWYRLGDVYRHLKDYRDAILAYQQADLLDPELTQDRKESGQILYGSSEAASKQAILPDPAPAFAEIGAEPVTADQEIQTAVVPEEGPAETEVVAALPEESQVVASEPEFLLEEPVGFARVEAIQVEQSVEETAVVSEETAVLVPLPAVEELPLHEIDASAGPVQAEMTLPESTPEEAAPLPLESEPVLVEAVEIRSAETPMMTLEDPVDETVTALEQDELPVAAAISEASVEEIPAVLDDLEPADLPEPEPALLEEDPASGFLLWTESPAQEDLTPAGEAVSDMSSAGWNEENYPYTEFEHETEVFIPETREEALDQWLPVTEAESFNSEARSDSVYMPDLELSSPEPPDYTEAVRVGHQPAPLPSQRHGVEASMAASLDVDVIVQDEYSQPVFIIPEGTEQEAPEELDESEQPDPASAVTREENEEMKEIEREIERFQQVVQHNPRNASAWDTLGTLYKSAHRYPDAILAYQQAVVVDPLKAPYHHHLGIIYAVEGRDEDAIKAFQEVIEIDPNHSLAHASLGGYYRRMGLEELAQKHIGRAMKNFYSSENEYNRACMEALRGHTEQSIELLRVALKNKQTYVDWVLRDPDLDSIRRDPRFKQLISDYTA